MSERSRLPADRAGRTIHISMVTRDGPLDCYATVNVYTDGRAGELFLRIEGQDAQRWSALIDAFAVAFSIALQHGASLTTLTDKMRGSRAEPVGRLVEPTSLLGDGNHLNASLLDLLGRWLEAVFAEAAA